jgi:hypothetical protein
MLSNHRDREPHQEVPAYLVLQYLRRVIQIVIRTRKPY